MAKPISDYFDELTRIVDALYHAPLRNFEHCVSERQSWPNSTGQFPNKDGQPSDQCYMRDVYRVNVEGCYVVIEKITDKRNSPLVCEPETNRLKIQSAHRTIAVYEGEIVEDICRFIDSHMRLLEKQKIKAEEKKA